MERDDIAFAGIAEQARLLRERTLSSVELVDLYLDRIERLDPMLNAFADVFAAEARTEAAEADGRLAAGESAPLLGVPVGIKDELDIAGQVSRHGTRAYDTPATADSEHVRRLRQAGAIVIGKTRLPELAITGFTESELNGDTRNPWDTTRTPGGSSGGSAAAVAAGLVGAASASDGAGSIRIPAANCGLFGLKPQRGRISLMPEAEHWYGLSKTGCLSRRVIDTALWLDVAAGPAPGDAHTPPPPEGSYVDAAKRDPGQLRVAFSTTPVRALAPPIVDPVVVEAVNLVAGKLTDLGHHVIARTPDYGSVGNEIAPVYLGGIRQHYEQVPHPERLERRTRGFAKLGALVPDRWLRAALGRREEHTARINQIFDDVDVLMTPVTGEPPVEVGKWKGVGALRTSIGMSRTYPFTAVWNYTGQPAASIPAMLTADGLPIGIMLIVPPNREDLLLSVAGQLEAALGWADRRPPNS
jgi:amidase